MGPGDPLPQNCKRSSNFEALALLKLWRFVLFTQEFTTSIEWWSKNCPATAPIAQDTIPTTTCSKIVVIPIWALEIGRLHSSLASVKQVHQQF